MFTFVLGSLVVTVVSVVAARWLAAKRARTQWKWMLAAALLGPLPLPVLLVLPARDVSRA